MTDSQWDVALRGAQVGERPLLLVIDDDPIFQKQIDFLLSDRYHVFPSLKAVDGDAKVLLHADTIVLDLSMPGIDGLSFIQVLATLNPKPKLLIASGHDDVILELAKSSASMYGLHRTEALRKPVNRENLLKALDLLDRAPPDDLVRSAVVQTFSDEEILAGFAAGQFTTHYQPQVDLATRKVVGLEALARWNHPALGCLSPAHFVEQIEDSQITESFTLAVARSAISDAARLERSGLGPIKMSVNVPPVVLQSSTFVERLIAELDSKGLAAQYFQCEVTERGMENPTPAVASSLARLRMKGVRLSLDDFGIGQSGLSKLKSRAFDEIKIDRSFIRDLVFSAESRSIVESVAQLSQSVGLRIVAEGVEDEVTLECVESLGINVIQGYFFAKPMDFSDLQIWLKDWASLSHSTQEMQP